VLSIVWVGGKGGERGIRVQEEEEGCRGGVGVGMTLVTGAVCRSRGYPELKRDSSGSLALTVCHSHDEIRAG
jgi:hypothetical protein